MTQIEAFSRVLMKKYPKVGRVLAGKCVCVSDGLADTAIYLREI